MKEVRPAVKALIKKDDKFLILKDVVNGVEFWDLPGGKVEYGESPYDTLHREVMEEIHVEVEIIRPLGLWWFFRENDKTQIVCATMLCKPKSTDIDITKNPADENITDYKWVTLEQLKTDHIVNETFVELLNRIDVS